MFPTNAVSVFVLLWSILNCGKAAWGPGGLYVTDVTTTSAVLHWRDHGSMACMTDFIAICVGIRHYIASDGTSSSNIDKLTHFVPEGLDHVLLGGLQPNFNYSCIVAEELVSGALRPSKPCLFSTHYKAPVAPKAPKIQSSSKGSEVQIQLFPTSSEYGPISGYEVQFHVVDNKTPYNIDGLPSIPEQLLKPDGPIATLPKAQGTAHALSFQISYTSTLLPLSIEIGEELLHGALKNGASYCVITVAFTRGNHREDDSGSILYSTSGPSYPFVASGLAPHLHKTPVGGPSGHIPAAIILGVMLPTLVILYICCIGAFIMYRDLQTRKHQGKLWTIVRDAPRPKQSRGAYLPLRQSAEATDKYIMTGCADLAGITAGTWKSDLTSSRDTTTGKDIHHAFDVEHSCEHLGHHDHLERAGDQAGFVPVLPRHPLSPTTTGRKPGLSQPMLPDTHLQILAEGLSASEETIFCREDYIKTHFPSKAELSTTEISAHCVTDKASIQLNRSVSAPSGLASSTGDTEVSVYCSAQDWSQNVSDDLDDESTWETQSEPAEMVYKKPTKLKTPPAYKSLSDAVKQWDIQKHNLHHSISALHLEMERPSAAAVTDTIEQRRESETHFADHLTSELTLGEAGGQEHQTGSSTGMPNLPGRQLQSQVSSSVFLPRGMSSAVWQNLLSPYTVRTLQTQLSFGSSHEQQTDQAPELEMDLFDL